MIGRLLHAIFGSGRNVIVETAGVFRENAEAAGQRSAQAQSAALAQYAAEFARPRQSLFDQVIDGLNRLPRPIMAFGVLGLITVAMVDPVWFAERMIGLGLVPEPLWWLMGAIVSFYFGARTLSQTQDFHRSVAETIARVPDVTRGMAELETYRPSEARSPGTAAVDHDAETTVATIAPTDNPALAEWQGRKH